MSIEQIISFIIGLLGVASTIITAIINRKIKKANKAIIDGEVRTAEELSKEIEELQEANKMLHVLIEVPEVVTMAEQILNQPGSGKGKKLLATTQLKEKAIAYGLQLSQEQIKVIDSQIEKVLEAPTKGENAWDKEWVIEVWMRKYSETQLYSLRKLISNQWTCAAVSDYDATR